MTKQTKNIRSTAKRMFNTHRALLSNVTVLWVMQHLSLEDKMRANNIKSMINVLKR